MHRGRIKKIVHGRGFGFIDVTDGREAFFHQSSLIDCDFTNLKEDQEVEFEIEKSPRGATAFNVKAV